MAPDLGGGLGLEGVDLSDCLQKRRKENDKKQQQ